MVESYRPHLRKDDEDARSHSQTAQTNTAEVNAIVQSILDQKDGTVHAIRPQQSLHDAVIALRDHHIGALLVTDQTGALLGILSERDIVRKLAETPGTTLPQKVEDVMTRKVETCSPSDPLVTVLKRMTSGRFRHMPVLDGDRVAGIVTIGDVVHYRLTALEHEALQIKQLIVG
ncbi:CBS domain-containing protein [Pseudooceanicola nitratireducens]|uniref:CBS domain-containing protein n=1 Tax=Pseudooceanicola nitratireducens TaxID=517719 RepID=UPI001C98B704|nr:CBS domain-containing protein [Pseudooceanicola nitratireducens]MBY6158703.1 CBS domain-containing protein [Pseudooceanicola nitratireducens]